MNVILTSMTTREYAYIFKPTHPDGVPILLCKQRIYRRIYVNADSHQNLPRTQTRSMERNKGSERTLLLFD